MIVSLSLSQALVSFFDQVPIIFTTKKSLFWFSLLCFSSCFLLCFLFTLNEFPKKHILNVSSLRRLHHSANMFTYRSLLSVFSSPTEKLYLYRCIFWLSDKRYNYIKKWLTNEKKGSSSFECKKCTQNWNKRAPNWATDSACVKLAWNEHLMMRSSIE